jgi:hypothetical protein
MEDKNEKLPPAEAYTFDKTKRFKNKDGAASAHESMLFLGQNSERRSWAVLKHWPQSPHKSSEVVFYNDPEEGDLAEVKSIQDLSMMYPMKVFKIINQAQSMRHLKQFIMYVYLYAGQVRRVFPQSLSTVEEVLRAAINVTDKYYTANGMYN